ncbi:MAG: YMGG-like glycine zipper-containing protein [Verrucomicrobiota bacterium]
MKTIHEEFIQPHTPMTMAIAAAALLLLTSCSTPTQTGALGGAAGGAIIGGVVDDSARGAALGAVLGGLAGGLAGSYAEYRAQRYRAPQNPYPPSNPSAPAPTSPTPPAYQPVTSGTPEYPTARPASERNRVFSPHPPHNLINTEGFQSGDLAIDPTTNKVFRIP